MFPFPSPLSDCCPNFNSNYSGSSMGNYAQDVRGTGCNSQNFSNRQRRFGWNLTWAAHQSASKKISSRESMLFARSLNSRACQDTPLRFVQSVDTPPRAINKCPNEQNGTYEERVDEQLVLRKRDQRIDSRRQEKED